MCYPILFQTRAQRDGNFSENFTDRMEIVCFQRPGLFGDLRRVQEAESRLKMNFAVESLQLRKMTMRLVTQPFQSIGFWLLNLFLWLFNYPIHATRTLVTNSLSAVNDSTVKERTFWDIGKNSNVRDRRTGIASNAVWIPEAITF